MSSQLIKREQALSRLALFLQKYQKVINVCMVDFITKDIFSNVLDNDIQKELLHASDQNLIDLPSKLQQPGEAPNALDMLIREMSSLTLESLGVTTSKDQLFFPDKSSSLLTHFDRFMSQKKMHEVLMMSEIMSALCEHAKVTKLVDVGSGKAYLSQVLAAMRQNLQILAIDSQSGNLQGAQKRSANLEKQWVALIRRAKFREAGEDPPRRGKRGKNWKFENPDPEKDQDSISKNDEDDSQQISNQQKDKFENSSSEKLVLNNLNYETVFVDTSTNLKSLFEIHFQETPETMGLMGLHTCGNLAPNSLKIFLANNSMKFCCNVGCCYHHLDEEYYENPNNKSSTDKNPSFPLSNFLKEIKFSLGRNARMIAAQPMDRLITNKQLPSQSLLWRAILQHILLKHKSDLAFDDQHVGRIASKSVDFEDYVHKAFKKLGFELKMTNEEIQSIYSSMSERFGHKLNAFYQFRSIFAPLIEGLILLDRLTFLDQQPQVAEAHLTQLFDAYISPRCYAIIAIKK